MTLREEPGSGSPANRETTADPQEPAATPAPADDHVSPEGPDPEARVVPPDGPGHPADSSGLGKGGSPAGRRRSRAALLIGGSVAVCLVGLGGLATVLLLHARTQGRPAAPPAVFRLGVGECVGEFLPSRPAPEEAHALPSRGAPFRRPCQSSL